MSERAVIRERVAGSMVMVFSQIGEIVSVGTSEICLLLGE